MSQPNKLNVIRLHRLNSSLQGCLRPYPNHAFSVFTHQALSIRLFQDL